MRVSVRWKLLLPGLTFLALLSGCPSPAVRVPPAPAPPPPSPAPHLGAPYERFLARFTHAALYVLLFAMPLSGWMMSSARGFPVSWFGFFTLPDLVAKNKSLYEALLTTHETLAWVLGAVVTLHVAAALKHHFMHRDDVLRRMLPFTSTPGPKA